jgi:tetratricopeptide (TPR) repeat protein
VEGDFQAAIRDLGALQREEPNYLDVPSLLQRAQGRARAAVQKAMEQGAALEMQGQLPEALQEYRRAQQIDPSASGAEESIRRVATQMTADGTTAFNNATSYYILARYSQAIPLLEKAVKLLPDGDPNKKTAQDRLDEIKRRQ